ncbi:MAG: hypothetical protein ACYC2O_09045 [Microthrixaceae bacterium]
MPRPLTRTLAALAVAALPLAAVACGSDDDAADATTTTEAADLAPCAEVYPAGDTTEGP